MADERSVVALFVDVRGFTRWSEANEVFANLDIFIEGFLSIVRRVFSEDQGYSLKPLGDGAMIVRETSSAPTQRETVRELELLLRLIRRVDDGFATHCEQFAHRVGHNTDLRLGWGIVRGKVLRVGEDWAGGNLNKCSRLCNEARPFGVIVDRDDFPTLPRKEVSFIPQLRRLTGISDQVPVWVTSEIASQFIPRERIREEPEVHVAGTCVRQNDGNFEILVARRTMERRIYPGKLEGCGGQLRRSESFEDGVRRHYKLDLGLDVQVLGDLHKFYEIREPDLPLIPGIRFLCRLAGNFEPRLGNHSEVQWLPENEFRRMPSTEFVGMLRDEVVDLLDLLKARPETSRMR